MLGLFWVGGGVVTGDAIDGRCGKFGTPREYFLLHLRMVMNDLYRSTEAKLEGQ